MKKEKNREKGEKTVEFVVEHPDLQPEKTDETAVTDEPSGRYEIIEELAHGGSGKILVAFDRHIGRKTAFGKRRSAKNGDEEPLSARSKTYRQTRTSGNCPRL